jgi:hypothetical protein
LNFYLYSNYSDTVFEKLYIAVCCSIVLWCKKLIKDSLNKLVFTESKHDVTVYVEIPVHVGPNQGMIIRRDVNNTAAVLVEDNRLCLGVILKWNKIYTSSNTTILYFINLNNGN